jgi:hypothetical protein
MAPRSGRGLMSGATCRQRAFVIGLGLTLSAMTAAMKVYIVQEVFSVLLATAAAVMALMLVPVAFVFLQSGAGHALSWLKTSMRGWRSGSTDSRPEVACTEELLASALKRPPQTAKGMSNDGTPQYWKFHRSGGFGY